MEENTIFQGTQIPPQQVSSEEVLPPSQSEDLTKPEVPQTPPRNIFPIIKIVFGVILFAVFVFVVFNFILPKITGKKGAELVTLSYWGLWEDDRVMRSIISEFERQNSNIKVNYVKQDVKEYRERLTTRIQNGTGPDIFRIHNTWLPMFSDYLVPFSEDVIKKEDFRKQFYQTAENDLTKNGALYGIPLQIDTLSLFINTELFKATGLNAPANWDDFAKFSRALTVKEQDGKIKTAGAAMGTFNNITHAPDIISLLFLQSGVDIKNISSTPKAASDALDFYTEFAKGEGGVWNETLDASVLAFAKGNLAMYFGFSWDIFTIKALNPQTSFKIYPVPHLQGRNMTVASYWAEGISAKSKHKKEAMMFLKFLARAETEQKFFTEASKTRLFGEPYARVDLADLLKTNELLYPFVSQAKESASSFFASDTFDNGLNTQMNAYLGSAVNSVLSNTSSQTAVEILSKGVSQVLKQYGQQ